MVCGKKNLRAAEKQRNNVKICLVCHQNIGLGIKYHCKISHALANIVISSKNMPELVSEQVAGKIIRSKGMTTNGGTKAYTIKLHNTNDPDTRIVLNPTSNSTVFFHKKLDQLQSGLGNLSNKKMRGVASWVRTVHDRKSVPANFKTHCGNHKYPR